MKRNLKGFIQEMKDEYGKIDTWFEEYILNSKMEHGKERTRLEEKEKEKERLRVVERENKKRKEEGELEVRNQKEKEAKDGKWEERERN